MSNESPVDREGASAPSRHRLLSRSSRRELGLFSGIAGVWLVVFIILSVTQPAFFSQENLVNMVRSSAILFVLAIGMTFVIISGGIDLSMGSMMAFSGVLLASLLTHGVPTFVSIILVLLAATTIGALLNGYLIAKVGLSFFVVTLGSLSLLRGAVYVWTNGQTTYVDDYRLVHYIGNGSAAGIPVPIILMVVLFVAALLVLRFTHLGRSVYAIGGNEDASHLAGINVVRVRIIMYALTALLAGLAGIIQTGRLDAASPVVGTGIELNVAAAVLLGGTSFAGGVGSLWGTLVGVLFIATLQNGLSVAGLPSYWQLMLTGAVLILAVLFDRLKSRRAT